MLSHIGKFSLLLKVRIRVLKLGFKSGTLSYEVEILGFWAGIWALGLKFGLLGWDLGFGIRYWAQDLGLDFEAGIWVL